MPDQSVIVWDLETVPDLGGFAAANDLVGKSELEVREAIGEKFPKHIYHSIVCIGALIAHWELDHWAVDAVDAPHMARASEPNQVPNKRACWHGALPQGQSCSGDHDGEAYRSSQRRSAMRSVYRGQTHRRLGRSGSS